MIANLTGNEYDALVAAAAFYKTELQERMDAPVTTHEYREARSQARALESGFEKIRQLAPEVKLRG